MGDLNENLFTIFLYLLCVPVLAVSHNELLPSIVSKPSFEITISAATNAYIYIFLNDQFMAVYKVTKCHGEQTKFIELTIYKPKPNAFNKIIYFLICLYIFCCSLKCV